MVWFEEQLWNQEQARIAAVSWTGGKDCNLALLKAWRNPSLRVTCLVVFTPQDAIFHAHPLPVMEEQAKSLSLPLHRIIIPKGCTDFIQAYVDGIQTLKDDHSVQVIVTGDMDLVGTMQRNWIEECAECAAVGVYLPLWKADRETVLREVIDNGFRVVFSCVKTPYFDASWIGRFLDQSALDDLRKLCLVKYENVKPLDLGGENGEYHTMCVDGPLYRRNVQIALVEPKQVTGLAGQKEGERWWVLCTEKNE
jgi:diphthine-ammonia ligase